MSFAKRMIERQQHQRDMAEAIALEAGVLRRCDVHADVLYDTLNGPEDAYRLGNQLFTQKDPRVAAFDTRREMTDKLQEAIADHGHECPDCARIRDE